MTPVLFDCVARLSHQPLGTVWASPPPPPISDAPHAAISPDVPRRWLPDWLRALQPGMDGQMLEGEGWLQGFEVSSWPGRGGGGLGPGAAPALPAVGYDNGYSAGFAAGQNAALNGLRFSGPTYLGLHGPALAAPTYTAAQGCLSPREHVLEFLCDSCTLSPLLLLLFFLHFLVAFCLHCAFAKHGAQKMM